MRSKTKQKLNKSQTKTKQDKTKHNTKNNYDKYIYITDLTFKDMIESE